VYSSLSRICCGRRRRRAGRPRVVCTLRGAEQRTGCAARARAQARRGLQIAPPLAAAPLRTSIGEGCANPATRQNMAAMPARVLVARPYAGIDRLRRAIAGLPCVWAAAGHPGTGLRGRRRSGIAVLPREGFRSGVCEGFDVPGSLERRGRPEHGLMMSRCVQVPSGERFCAAFQNSRLQLFH
jgi:hypothetical protein